MLESKTPTNCYSNDLVHAVRLSSNIAQTHPNRRLQSFLADRYGYMHEEEGSLIHIRAHFMFVLEEL